MISIYREGKRGREKYIYRERERKGEREEGEKYISIYKGKRGNIYIYIYI